MINWISNWAQGIIVAVIIGTIIEMVLPEGNCKKYVKVLIFKNNSSIIYYTEMRNDS